jgi:hypothetical protein
MLLHPLASTNSVAGSGEDAGQGGRFLGIEVSGGVPREPRRVVDGYA